MSLKVKILLDKTDPSNRLHVLALDREAHCYLSIKISLSEELVNRVVNQEYKDILNAFMIFKIDVCEAFSEAKSNEKFRKNSGSFKDTSFLWKISPKEVTDVYERVFTEFKRSKPKKLSFITCYPRENKSESNNNISELLYNNNETENSGINNCLSDSFTSQYSQTNNTHELNSLGNSEVLNNLPDETNYLIPQFQYGEPELDNFETLCQTKVCDNTNDINFRLETIRFGNSGELNNIYNLYDGISYLIPHEGLEFENFEGSCNNTIENSEVMVDNINYFIPQSQYLLSSNETSFNSDYEYDDTSGSIIQPFDLLMKNYN